MSAGHGAYSLRRRLIVSVLGASILAWSISLAVVVYVSWHETSDVFDDAMKEGARLALVLGTALQQRDALSGQDPVTEQPAAKLKLYYQIVADDGRVLRRATKAPEQAFSDPAARHHGFRDAWVDGQAWRIYVLRPEGATFQVQLGQPWKERLELLGDVAEALVWPALVLLSLLGGFCWWIIRRLLQPIERTAGRIAAKSPRDLEPLPTHEEPRELLPIVRAFNGVFAQLTGALQTERRFTADAAHELRTPLAALRMRIQLMQRQNTGAVASQLAVADAVTLQSLRDEVDRCTTLVEGLFTLARLDPQRPEALQKEPVDLVRLLERLDLGPGVEIDCQVATVQAHPALLQSVLRNIVDNARRYCPAGARLRIETRPHRAGIRIAVRDDGPGVNAADRTRLAERFFRVLGTEKTGSGLGLSIVSRIAALHGATLSFESGLAGQGLGVVLDFPAT